MLRFENSIKMSLSLKKYKIVLPKNPGLSSTVCAYGKSVELIAYILVCLCDSAVSWSADEQYM